jgi:olefin beta-lactone synthetase
MATSAAGDRTPSANVAELLEPALVRRPDKPALIERMKGKDRITTFAELNMRAMEVAALMAERGIGQGDAVLFFEHPSRELYAALIATFRLGAVAVFVEPSAGRRILDAACAMWPPKALVAAARAHLLRLVSRGVRRIPVKFVSSGWAPLATSLTFDSRRPAPVRDIARVGADAPALLTFTSGSTGQPKGALRTHGILRAQLAALEGSVAALPGERDLVSMPIVVLMNLATGAESVLPDADLRRPGDIDPAPVLRQIETHDVRRLTVSPALLERLCAGEPGGMSRVASIVTGGGPVFPDLVAAARRAAPSARVVSVYGSTEAEPIAHVNEDEVSSDDLAAMRSGAGLLAGSIDRNVNLRIIRPSWGTPIRATTLSELDDLTVPAGEVGEIVVSGAHVVPGYLHGRGDEETKFRLGAVTWHRTGDVGRVDPRGRLWLLGRANAVISDKRGTLYPFAVECAARMELPGQRLAAVAHEGRRVLVVETPGDHDSHARHLLARTLAWAEIDDFVFLMRVPTDRRHNSKVDYPALLRTLDDRRRRSRQRSRELRATDSGP